MHLLSLCILKLEVLAFDSFKDVAIIPQYVKDIAFVLAFVGFGTKAGMVPLHTWLPKAHPSAPSNVSALMSAVMLKIAIYGIVRYIFDFNAIASSPDYVWIGVGIIAIGSVSSLVGILYALVENDIKRALAFSSIENVGIIFIGLGLSIVFAAFHLQYFVCFGFYGQHVSYSESFDFQRTVVYDRRFHSL